MSVDPLAPILPPSQSLDRDPPAPRLAQKSVSEGKAVSAPDGVAPKPGGSTPADPQQTPSVGASQAQTEVVSYRLAEDGHRVYFEVIDKQTGMVVRQVPPSEVLNGEVAVYNELKSEEQQRLEPKKG